MPLVGGLLARPRPLLRWFYVKVCHVGGLFLSFSFACLGQNDRMSVFSLLLAQLWYVYEFIPAKDTTQQNLWEIVS